MNSNGREVEFHRNGEVVQMLVERDFYPFDVYLCGTMHKDDDGYYRFHPEAGVVMHCRLLKFAVDEVSSLNGGVREFYGESYR